MEFFKKLEGSLPKMSQQARVSDAALPVVATPGDAIVLSAVTQDVKNIAVISLATPERHCRTPGVWGR